MTLDENDPPTGGEVWIISGIILKALLEGSLKNKTENKKTMNTITVSNYNQKVTDSIVPKKLRTDHETIKSMLDLYDEDKEIKEYIDLYFSKLNSFLEKEGNEETPEKPEKKKVPETKK